MPLVFVPRSYLGDYHPYAVDAVGDKVSLAELVECVNAQADAGDLSGAQTAEEMVEVVRQARRLLAGGEAVQAMELKPFDSAAMCPKCGVSGADATYRAYRGHRMLYTTQTCTDRCPTGEHLDRVCKRCGFTWPEAVLTPGATGV